MKTPAGKECPFFYGNYFRGRDREECRLLEDAKPPLPWKRYMCSTCPVPEIIQANACPNMILEPYLVRPFPFMRQEVRVKTYCTKTRRSGFDPHIGCGECHPLPPIFSEGKLFSGESRDSDFTD